MRDTILYDSAMRLFGDLVTPEVSADGRDAAPGPTGAVATRSKRPAIPTCSPSGAGGMAEAATILRAAGHHAAPIPLAETMLARWLCAACRLRGRRTGR